jgi:hypothetical protein
VHQDKFFVKKPGPYKYLCIGKFGRIYPIGEENLLFQGQYINDVNPPIAKNFEFRDAVSGPWMSAVFHCPISSSSKPAIFCAKFIMEVNDFSPSAAPVVGSDEISRQKFESYQIALFLFIAYAIIITIAFIYNAYFDEPVYNNDNGLGNIAMTDVSGGPANRADKDRVSNKDIMV